MNTIETARATIETANGWKIGNVVEVDPAKKIWMGMAMTTRLGDVGVPERTFAIHVVNGVVSPVHADTIEGLRAELANRERRFAA